MTLTDTPVDAPSEADADIGTATAGDAADSGQVVAGGPPPRPASGIIAPLVTADSAVVGRLFVGTSLLSALGAAVIGVLLAMSRANVASPTDLFGGLNAEFRLWTLHRSSLLLLVVMPLMLGVAMILVPSQIGARGLAFPRAALASFWTWLTGAVIMVASAFAGGGWGAIDGVTANESDAIALTLLGTAVVIAALLLGALIVATTVISSRSGSSSLLDLAPFSWSALIASAVWLLTLPVAIANIVIIYADLRGRPAVAFGQPESPDIWLQLDWLVEQPAVYAMAVPVLGIAIGAAGAALGVESSRHGVLAAVIGLFGLLAVGGWSQDYFTGSQDYRDGVVYVVFGLAAVVPVIATLGALAELAMRGSRTPSALLSTRLLGAVAALVLLGAATAAGALRVIEPLDLLETTATWAVFQGVTAAGIVAAVTALWQHGPRMIGASLDERAGMAAIALIAAGGLLAILADLVDGLIADTPIVFAVDRRIYDTGDTTLAVVSLLGSALLALGVAVAVLAVASAAAASARSAALSSQAAESATS